MNYLKTFFIATILLSVYNNLTCGAFFEPDVQNTATQETVTQDETTETETPAETPVEEKDELQAWKDHLELLTIEGEYWDTEDNVPTYDWKSTAFDLAKKIVTKDATQADTIKTEFLDAINAKIALEKGKFSTNTIDLVKEFNDMVDAASQPEEEKTEETETVIPETAPVQPVQEEPAPVTEIPAIPTPPETLPPTTTETTPATPSDTSQNTINEWKNQLAQIRREGTRFGDIDDILMKTYDVANQLIQAKTYTEQHVLSDFERALVDRADLHAAFAKSRAPEQNIYPLEIPTTMNFFKRAIGMFVPEEEFLPGPQAPSAQEITAQQELQKLREEFAQKDEFARAEREKMEMQIQAALELARKREEEATPQPKESEVQKLQAILQQKIAEAKAEMDTTAKLREKELRAMFEKNIEQQAATQKAAAQKGIVSTIREGFSNWWYGPSAQKPGELSQEEQNKMFIAMAKHTKNPKATEALLNDLQNKLLSVTTREFWDQKNNMPNETWIIAMQKIIFALVITYKVMKLPEISDIIQKGLTASASGKIKPESMPFIIAEIQKMVNEHEQQLRAAQQQEELLKQQQEARRQQRVQLKREKQEQIVREQQKAHEQMLLAQRKLEEEQRQKEEAIKKHEELTTSYNNHKKEWYTLLDKVAQHKPTTHHENRAHTHEALKHSQKLLHLAHNMPTKNKHELAQKLKQKFSVALLEQHKNNPETVNIYHDMDIFNQEINKMLD